MLRARKSSLLFVPANLLSARSLRSPRLIPRWLTALSVFHCLHECWARAQITRTQRNDRFLLTNPLHAGPGGLAIIGNPSQPNSTSETMDSARAAEEKAAAEKAATKLAAAKAAEAEATVAQAAATQLKAAQTAALQLADRKFAEARTAVGSAARAAHEPKTEPKLRHEFVGMMFAVAIGEVGVQAAILVQAGNWMHFLPAYSHLLLTAVLIAASWVGWTLSPSPGAREDVRSVFHFGFLVLLLDVFLVVVYFILAKTVDISGEAAVRLRASARPEAFWILVIFGTYCVWDIVTKVVIYLVERRTEPWFQKFGSRMIPTIICLVLAYGAKPLFERADPPHVLTADLALLSLVLLFRALKGLTDARTKVNIFWAVLWGLGFAVGTIWTSSYPLPRLISDQILTEPSERVTHSENPKPSNQEPRPPAPDQKSPSN
jgi:hypothetical protein